MILLGSTGSIGVNTLKIAKEFGLKAEGLVAGKNIALLNRQIEEFRPSYVCIQDKRDIPLVNHKNVFYGEEGTIELIQRSHSKTVVNALVGFLGLKPTIESLKLGKKLALANKESLVVAGAFVDNKKIVPIDSEHFGVWYLLGDKKPTKITITASGGAFRDAPISDLYKVSVSQALSHPNWKMGKKITIDSATMTNKLFELLEARWLFGIKNLEAIIEKKSIIHAFVDFADGSTTAHFAKADMRLPIAYALLGKVEKNIVPHINLLKLKEIEFKKIEKERYPIWEIKDEVLASPKRGVVINAANEVAIKAFLEGKIGFLDISKSIIKAFKKFENIAPKSFDEIFEIDRDVRKYTTSLLKSLS